MSIRPGRTKLVAKIDDAGARDVDEAVADRGDPAAGGDDADVAPRLLAGDGEQGAGVDHRHRLGRAARRPAPATTG